MFKKFTLTHWIFLGIALGILGGWLIGEPIQPIAQPVGDIFLRLLKMIIVPLIVSSIMAGVLGIGDTRNLGRLGGKTILYYLFTSTIAILTGLVLINIVRPGVGADIELQATPELGVTDSSTVWGLILRLVPENPIRAMAEGDMLAVIFFTLLFGVFVTQLPERGRMYFKDLFDNIFEVMMKMTRFVIWFAPLGVFGLIANIVATTGFSAFGSLLRFFVTVLFALLFHALVTLPLLIRIFGKVRHPYRHLRAMTEALLTAFSTASSNATLPVTMRCVEDNSGVSNRISSFVLPIGATVNMDGTALYECVVAMFIAQVYGIELTFLQQWIVVFVALLTSIGVAGVPMASLVAIAIILKAVGLPLEGIGLVLVTDRVLDMVRTTVNIWSDSCGAVVIARTEGEETKLI
ncbi:dicarboxylate/amino acid:cation symporter [bacterium]|nr:dicarboxylate/amino acid:cation symporter [bacterium]MBU1984486.1 dicarboxylate/amino acid:cation symporter [bacterium]